VTDEATPPEAAPEGDQATVAEPTPPPTGAGEGDAPDPSSVDEAATDEVVDDQGTDDEGTDDEGTDDEGTDDEGAVTEATVDEAADDEADADLQAAADAVEVDLELLLAERAQYLEAYQRAQADFENYRKQAQKRQEDAVVRSLGRFVDNLLPVLDACDAALAHGANEVEPVLAALYGALEKEGLERIDPKGSAFDPAEAEAVLHEPGEGGEQMVSEVLRPGYRWRGQVLRPAMVKVTD
jgi:molecular chaperone GrpE